MDPFPYIVLAIDDIKYDFGLETKTARYQSVYLFELSFALDDVPDVLKILCHPTQPSSIHSLILSRFDCFMPVINFMF